MPDEKWRMDLKKDIREALKPLVPTNFQESAVLAALQSALPHLEAAYKRGEIVAKLRQGSRLVEENERLRRELRRRIPNPRKEDE